MAVAEGDLKIMVHQEEVVDTLGEFQGRVLPR